MDHIFAVGDYVEKELRVLESHFRYQPIHRVYNGIPARKINLATRKANKARMTQYAQNLFGDRPDWILTHVARPVLSKAVWRDLGLLHSMEPLLKERNERAVYFMLGSLGGAAPAAGRAADGTRVRLARAPRGRLPRPLGR